jgi:cobalt-zinc-cadmium efflux system protein
MHAHSHHDSGSHHHHGHGECSHDRRQDQRRLTITLVLITAYLFAEVIGGWLSNSLALMADAGHMLSDAAALGLSVFAIWIGQRPATPRQSYGYYRAEILAALANGAALVTISILIFIEAWKRLGEPAEVQGPLMMGIALGGLLVNLIALWILHAGRSGNLNVRGAWLHVLTDALGSVAAVGAGIFIWAYGWYWVDPVASMLIGALVLHSSWVLLKEAVAILMQNAPGHLDVDEIREVLLQCDGVQEVHDLHVWTITTGLESLSTHVVMQAEHDYAQVLQNLRTTLHDRFRIDHVTIQIEPLDFPERTSPI